MALRLEQLHDYCAAATQHGIREIALTEHAFRFREVRAAVGDFWTRWGHEPTAPLMAQYFDFHARNSLDDYVAFALAAKESGLPVKVGLEVDLYRDQMSDVARLLEQYPFDVLIGSVHWLDTWQFDDLDNEHQMAQWHLRDLDATWSQYAECIDELVDAQVVDVLAHPDVIKVAGYRPADETPYWDQMAAAVGRAGLTVECSSAGWFKPVNEQYPSAPLLDRFLAAGATVTTASDAHHRERIGARASDIASLLRQRGVAELASFDQRQRTMVPLEVS